MTHAIMLRFVQFLCILLILIALIPILLCSAIGGMLFGVGMGIKLCLHAFDGVKELE